MIYEKLLKKYKLFFGENAPIPPDHIMETLVEMKENGSFKEKIEKLAAGIKKSQGDDPLCRLREKMAARDIKFEL